jgi:hypothetical protein
MCSRAWHSPSAKRLEAGRFVEHAVVTDDEEYVATEPVEVAVVPRALVS